MSNNPVPAPKPKGRHRAAPPADDPSNLTFDQILHPTQSIPIVPTSRRERRDQERADESRRRHQRKTTALASGSFAVVAATGGVLGLQNVSIPSPRTSQQPVVSAASSQGMVLAAGDAALVFEGPKVSTQAAPPPPPPPAPAPVVRVEQAAPAPAPVKAAPAAAVPPPDPAPVTNKAAAIANAALAQVGRYQDCTMLVTNSLKSVGITFHDWPIGYLSLGRQVSMAEAVPGDLLYYVNGAGTSVAGLAHIAVYIGNGKAVHGGFNGNETVIWSVNVGYGAGTPPTAVVRVA